MVSNFHFKGARILIVDDNVDAAFVMQLFLELEQAQVKLAYSVPQAREILISFTPHLILSDLRMPEIDGFTFIQELRAQGNQTPAIALTGAAAPNEIQDALVVGFDAYLTKPADLSVLKNKVSEVLQRLPVGV